MAETLSKSTWKRVARLRRLRFWRNAGTLSLAVLGPVLAGLTFAVMGPLAGATSGGTLLRLVLTAIVISFATTALLLVVLLASRGLTGTDHVDGEDGES